MRNGDFKDKTHFPLLRKPQLLLLYGPQDPPQNDAVSSAALATGMTQVCICDLCASRPCDRWRRQQAFRHVCVAVVNAGEIRNQ